MNHEQKIDKTYTVDTLLQVWIECVRYKVWTSDSAIKRLTFYNAQKEALETLLGVTLSKERFGTKWWWLFERTTSSYLCVSTPLDGMLEASAWLSNKQVYDQVGAIIDAASLLRDKHFGLLRLLVEFVFGVVDKQVTSEELRKIGFDDDQIFPEEED